MKLSFIISVLDEENTIISLYEDIVKNIYNNNYEIIFIDDGSTDSSFTKMKQLKQRDKRIKLIKFKRNYGKSIAIDTGFKVCDGDIVFTLDADGQDNPKEISRFIKKIKEGYDVVSGWKKKRNDPISKRWPSKIFNFAVSKLFKMKLHDYNCGFKAYKKEVVKNIVLYGELHRYIPVLAKNSGYRVGEIVVEHRKREFGKSKYGKERYLRGFFDFLTIRLITKYSKSPIYFFGSLGVWTLFFGFLINIYMVIEKYILGNPISNRPILFLGVLLSVIGIQFISIGLVGELIIYLNHKKCGDINFEIIEEKEEKCNSQ